MADYKIVKYCKLCNKRFVVAKGESNKYYCDKCYPKLKRSWESQEEEK